MALFTVTLINTLTVILTLREERSGGENMFLLLSAPDIQRNVDNAVGLEELESANNLWSYLTLLAGSSGKEGTIFAEKGEDSINLEYDEYAEERFSDLDDHEILKRFFIHDIIANSSQEKFVTYSVPPAKRNSKEKDNTVKDKKKKKQRSRRKNWRESEGTICPDPATLTPIITKGNIPRRGKRYPDHLDPIMRYRLLARSGGKLISLYRLMDQFTF